MENLNGNKSCLEYDVYDDQKMEVALRQTPEWHWAHK